MPSHCASTYRIEANHLGPSFAYANYVRHHPLRTAVLAYTELAKAGPVTVMTVSYLAAGDSAETTSARS